MSAATEATLEELLFVARSQNTNLSNIQRLLSGGGGGSGSGAQANREAERSMRGLSAAAGAASAALGALKLAGNILGGILGLVTGVFQKLFTGLTQTIINLTQFGQAAMLGTARLSDFYSALGDLPFFMGTIFKMYADIIRIREATLDAFSQISQSGATFGGSLETFRNSAFRARLTMQEFQEVVRASSEGLASVGMTEGVARFGSVISQLTSGPLARALFGLGYSARDLAQGAGTFITLIGGMNRARGMSDTQLAEGAGNLLLQIDLLAKATGKNREEIEKELKEKKFQGAFQYYTQSLSESARTMLTTVITRVEAQAGPAAANFVRQFVMTGGGPLIAMNEEMGTLYSAIGPTLQGIVSGFARAGTDMTLGAVEREALQERLLDQLAKTYNNNILQPLGRSGAYLNLSNNALLNLSQLFQRQVTANGRTEAQRQAQAQQSVAEQEKARRGSASAAREAELSVRQFGQNIFSIVSNFITPIAQKLEQILRSLVDFALPYVKRIIDWLIGQFNYIKSAPSLEEGLRRFINSLTEGASKIWDTIRPVWVTVIKPVATKLFEGLLDFIRPYLANALDEILLAINNWAFNIVGERFGVKSPEKMRAKVEMDKQDREVDRLQRLYRDYVSTIGVNAGETRKANDELVAGQRKLNELRKRYSEVMGGAPYVPVTDTPESGKRHSGTIGMTGNWWEKESATLNVQAGETVATQDQIKQIVDYASSGGNQELSRLNTLMAQLIKETQRVAENTANNVKATKDLNGNAWA